jgi:hypothetical protein
MIRTLTDWLFNKTPPAQDPKENLGIFRNVIGRFPPLADQLSFGISQTICTLIVANQEYPINGIATLNAVTIKARGGQVKLSIYEGMSGTSFSLIDDGQAIEISVIPAGQVNAPVSFYVQSTTAGCVVELLGLRLI